PDLNTSPILNYAPDPEYPENQWLSLQITDPGLLSAFGNIGVNVIVKNSDGTESGAAFLQSPPPVIISAAPGCADYYCITLSGSFPVNAYVDFRIHGQPDILPNSCTNFSYTGSVI